MIPTPTPPPNDFCKWEPRPGYLVLLPSRGAPKKGTIILPQSEVQKNNSGVCIKAGTPLDKEIFLNKECFFPNHSEYRIEDSDTGFLLYVIDADKILMFRVAPPDVARFSREKATDGFSFETITHDQRQ